MTAISKCSCDRRQGKGNCARRSTEQIASMSSHIQDLVRWMEVKYETANDNSIAKQDHGHVEDVWFFESRDDSLDRNLGVLF